MWQNALLDVLLNFIKIAGPAPIAGYFYFLLVEETRKAWKLNIRKKLWLTYSGLFLLSVASLKYLHWMFT